MKRLITFLCYCPDVLNKIEFNEDASNDEVTIYKICSYYGGEQLLSSAKLRGLITAESLNYIIKNGDDKDECAEYLHWQIIQREYYLMICPTL